MWLRSDVLQYFLYAKKFCSDFRGTSHIIFFQLVGKKMVVIDTIPEKAKSDTISYYSYLAKWPGKAKVRKEQDNRLEWFLLKKTPKMLAIKYIFAHKT